VHHIADPARIAGMCVLIFVSCAGLAATTFWAVTRTEETITKREVLMVIRALAASAFSSWLLLLVTPRSLAQPVGVFFLTFMVIVIALLAITHRRVHNQHKRQKEEGSIYDD
jgi:hypothetical protein